MVDAANLRESTPVQWRPGREAALLAVALAAHGAGFAMEAPLARLACHAAGGGIIFALAIAAGIGLVVRMRMAGQVAQLTDLATRETIPCVVGDAAGRIHFANRAAALKADAGDGLAGWLSDVFAAPAASVAELSKEAAARGAARADRISRDGHLRVSVLSAPGDLFLWRRENLTASDVSAGVADIGLPALVARSDGEIIGGNAAFDAFLGQVERPRTLAELLGGASVTRGAVASVATADGARAVRLHVVYADDAGLREVYFLPVDIAAISSASDFFDMLPVPMLKLALDGTVIVSNAAAAELFQRDVTPGTPVAQVLSGLGRSLTEWLRDAVAGRGATSSEFLQLRGRGGDRFVQVSLKPIDHDGRPAAVAVLTDATELKTLEAQFVQSQKMQAIGQLAGGVAHDFNNLLTAISGHCDLLLLRHNDADPAYADLVQISQNANRAAALVEQLLAFSRKQTLRPETVDLGDVLSDLTHLLSRLVGETVKLSLRSVDPAPRLRVDKRQLEQVIMNLVVNARDAMPAGGEIVVEASTETLVSELRRNRAVIPPGAYATIRVTDEGVGISPENLQKIFEPFFTTKQTGEGTGLGLSTAYGIVKQTGGFIFADSQVGHGSVFTLFLPIYAEDAIAAPRAAAAPSPPAPDPTQEVASRHGVVMLVEDEAPVRAFASRALRLRGLTVIEAETGEQALDRLSDADLHVDVFVTDVVMPGMDGPSWVRKALEGRPGTQVVFMSGYAEEALSDARERIPGSAFLQKPFSLQQLTETVQAHLA